MRELSGVKEVGFKMMQAALFRSAEVGSRTLINAAEGGKETHGQYMNDCKIGK
jgi:retinol dehydrogenase 12